jgi:16S rRNA (guanine966-N2)-methyltransferase
MRIIAGWLKGRIFSSPRNQITHPMSDKIRGALFNILGEIDGLNILDAFAGSGAIGYEAISRGALSVLAIESNRQAQNTILQNIQNLGINQKIKLIKSSANTWLETSNQKFEVVILDPPYQEPQPALLLKLSDCVKIGGIVIHSLPPTLDLDMPANYQLLKNKLYGDARLLVYRRIN